MEEQRETKFEKRMDHVAMTYLVHAHHRKEACDTAVPFLQDINIADHGLGMGCGQTCRPSHTRLNLARQC